MKSIVDSFKSSKGQSFGKNQTHKAVRIKGDLFDRLSEIGSTQGLSATALTNMLLANFVAEVDSDEPSWTPEKKIFDLDAEFEGVI
jgi:hypothetical protein